MTTPAPITVDKIMNMAFAQLRDRLWMEKMRAMLEQFAHEQRADVQRELELAKERIVYLEAYSEECLDTANESIARLADAMEWTPIAEADLMDGEQILVRFQNSCGLGWYVKEQECLYDGHSYRDMRRAKSILRIKPPRNGEGEL